MVAYLLNQTTPILNSTPVLDLSLIQNATNSLQLATLDMESLVRSYVIASNSSISDLVDRVQSAVNSIEAIGSTHLVMRYLGLGATIGGVTLIALAEVARNQKKLRALCSISGMGLTAFGVSQLFELRC